MIPQSGWGVKNFLNTHPTIDSLLCLKRISYFATYYTCIVSAKLIEIWLAPRNEVEKEMATHSSFLAWRIPGVGEPGGLPSMGLHGVGHNWSDLAAAVGAGMRLDHLAMSHSHTGGYWKGFSLLICSQMEAARRVVEALGSWHHSDKWEIPKRWLLDTS